MAHEIDFTTQAQGSAMFAYQPAWHGHGTVVREAQKSADALRIAGMDWDVHLTALAADMGEGVENRYRPISTHRATYRADTGMTLGSVGLRYQPLQNREAFAWMDDVVGESLAIWETCGSLRNGRTVWMLAKLPGTVEVCDRDLLDKYVLITNSHDGTGAVRLFPTSVRVVCANTLRLAVGDADRKTDTGLPIGLKLFHTVGGLSKRVQKARELLGVINASHDAFAESARAMLATPLGTQQVSDYFGGLVEGRSERSRGKVLTSLWDRFALPTNEGGFKANAWTAYNAASEFADHELRVTGTGEKRLERKFASCLFGTAHEFKERAWAAACELATVA